MNSKSGKRLNKSDRVNYVVERMRVDPAANPAVLSKELGVSERTVYRDIFLMENGNALKKRFSRREGRYLIENDLTLSPVKLTPAEALALHQAACNPALTGENFFAFSLRSALQKIDSALTPASGREGGELPDDPAVPAKPLSAARKVVSRSLLDALRRAIRNNRKVRLSYWSSAASAEEESTVAPYEVRETPTGWVLLANPEGKARVRLFKLERIRDMETLTESFRFPRRFHCDSLFDQAWNNPHEADSDIVVTLRFAPNAAALAAQYMGHPLAEVTPESDGSTICTMRVPSICDILWWVMAHGSVVEALAPKELREEVARHTAEMAALYATPSPQAAAAERDLNALFPDDLPDLAGIVVSSARLDEAFTSENSLTSGAVVRAPSEMSSAVVY